MLTFYLYPNIVEVRFWDHSIFTTRDREMYARPVTIYQGIDNPIQVRVRNQDQKGVNTTPYIVQVDIQDPVNNLTVRSFAVEKVDDTKGYGKFVITKDQVAELDQRIYRLTCRVIETETNLEHPVYVDDNYNVPIDLIVRTGFYSELPPLAGELPTNDFTLLDGGNI